MELVLIVEKSKVYSDFLKNSYLNKWGVPIGEAREATKLSESAGETLFGETPPSIITLNSPTEVKELVKEFENLDKIGELEQLKNNGIIVIANVNRQSTRKLESLFKKHGVVEVTNKNSITVELLNKVNLPTEVRQFLIDYVGQDYENLIPIVNALLKSPPSSHKNVRIEDVYIRLPKPPGSVPPWEIEKPIFEKNADKTIDVFRRVSRSSHYLVILSLLKNKLMLAYRIASLLDNNIKNDAEITRNLNISNNYYYKMTKQISVRQGKENLGKMLKVIMDTESNVKGGVNINGEVQMEVMLIKLINLVKR